MLDYKSLAQKHGTPLYVYDLVNLKRRVEVVRKLTPANGRIHYALKANNNREVLEVIKEGGFGVDVVSLGEIKWALESDFKPEQIIFSGVGKTKHEITEAIKLKIAQINVESEAELARIAECAKALKQTVNVAFRVNPDVDAKTHPYIRTGFRDNKFGVDFSEVSSLLDIVKANSSALCLRGLTLHIGSQIQDVEPFSAAIRKTLDLYKSIQSLGHPLSVFDVGGGLGIDYKNGNFVEDEKLITQYFIQVKNLLENEVENIYFEPGRMIVGPFGTLVTEVQYIKRTPHKSFVIVDTGMHHLLRPSLYQAYHRIEALRESSARREIFDVVGPICESTDVLGSARSLPSDLKSGDLLLIRDTGAYGAVMSSKYNLHAEAKEVSVRG